jgi:two-component system, OmpR family, KDP operon response regulator KdpE
MNSFSSEKATVLVVDPEPAYRLQLNLCLGRDGYRVLEAATGEEGIAKAAQFRPDAVLLDMGLPDMNGMAVLKRLREQNRVPVLIVSECSNETEKINALDNGAHDYITKPFSVIELMARLRVARRHTDPEKPEVFCYGPLSVDFGSRAVMVKQRRVKLTPTEYSLLGLLVKHAGKVLTYREMLRKIWGPHQIDKIGCLRVYLCSLRDKLEPDPANPELLITEQGVGIRLAG